MSRHRPKAPAGFDRDKPTVILPELRTMLCRDHAIRAREVAPDKAPIVQLGLFILGAAHPDVTAACGYDARTGATGDVKRLNSAIREFSPICCLVAEGELEAMLDAASGPPDRFKAWHMGKVTAS